METLDYLWVISSIKGELVRNSLAREARTLDGMSSSPSNLAMAPLKL